MMRLLSVFISAVCTYVSFVILEVSLLGGMCALITGLLAIVAYQEWRGHR